MSERSLVESAEIAISTFRTFEDGPPNLIPTGLPPIDRAIGGLFPGSPGILAATTGAGKSSLVLEALVNNAKAGVRSGLISLEDTPDVLGSRILARESGVDSLKIRKKDLTSVEKSKIKAALERIKAYSDNVRIEYIIGGSVQGASDAVSRLADHGCVDLWVDYIQKMRGKGADRRNEVGGAFSELQGRASKHNMAIKFVSQFARQIDYTKPPQIWWLKESGDLENEARLIILCHRPTGPGGPLYGRIAKCTFGGEGSEFMYVRDESGTLVEKPISEDF